MRRWYSAATESQTPTAAGTPLNDLQVRITTWERLDALSLSRTPEHALVTLIATQT